MTFRHLALLGTVAMVSVMGASPTLAFTHHPATPAEIQQTDALNAQALVNAQGTAGNQMPAAANASPAMGTNMSPLSEMAALPATLSAAAVQSQTGDAIGLVQKVITGADGKAATVNVALNGTQKVVAISASDLSYDATRNVLMATLTDEQIKSLPTAN